jgi:hypothetical protein
MKLADIGERVSIIEGKAPVIFVAPHGYAGNDTNTTFIVEAAAKQTNGFAVINRGWQRDPHVDIWNDKADCNNIEHCMENVVRDEFLDPIVRFKNRILNKFGYSEVFVFYIHGMSNNHRVLAGDPTLEMIIGYGDGKPPSLTCEEWRKDMLIYLLKKVGFTAYQAGARSQFAGWSKYNMNQLFRKRPEFRDSRVESYQVEIIHELREEPDIALLTGEYIGMAVEDLITSSSFDEEIDIRTYV